MSGRDTQGSSGGPRGFGAPDTPIIETLKKLWRRIVQSLRGKD